jgi:Immunity protein 52
MRGNVDKTSLMIRAHWRNRRETAADCGVRLAKVLTALAEVHPGFSRWFKKSSRKPSFEGFCTMPPVATELASVLERGMQFKDMPREPWPELGFSAGAWNGATGDAGLASFQITIGAYDTAQPGFNHFDLEVKDASTIGSLISTGIVRAVVVALIGAMDPDCVDVATNRWLFGAKEATCPAGGWMSYVRNPLGQGVDVPAGILVEIEGDGILAVVTADNFSDSDPTHVARAKNALNEALAETRIKQANPPAGIVAS